MRLTAADHPVLHRSDEVGLHILKRPEPYGNAILLCSAPLLKFQKEFHLKNIQGLASERIDDFIDIVDLCTSNNVFPYSKCTTLGKEILENALRIVKQFSNTVKA